MMNPPTSIDRITKQKSEIVERIVEEPGQSDQDAICNDAENGPGEGVGGRIHRDPHNAKRPRRAEPPVILKAHLW